MDIIYAVVGFILGIGLLVIIHELGHFYAARLFDVQVVKFSIGFGPSKRIWYDKHGTEYVISAIPLGGYVQLLDTLDTTKGKNNDAINQKSPWIRMIIFLAGPIYSILFAAILYWVVFIIGIAVITPILGNIDQATPAGLAKLGPGLEIIKINDQKISDWEEVTRIVINNLNINNKSIKLEVYNRKNQNYSTHVLHLNSLSINDNNGDILKSLGLEPFSIIEPTISEVIPKYPASQVGIKPGDLIISIDNTNIIDGSKVSEYLQNKAGKAVKIIVKRNKDFLNFIVVPASKIMPNGKNIGFIGVKYHSKPYPKELLKIHKYGIIESFNKAIIKTYNYTKITIYVLFETFRGKASLQNMAGPIAIGYYAGQNIKNGIEYFLNFLGIISIGLGVLNLLPIPWLDGGSIVHCWYEIIIGKPAPLKAIMLARSVGLIFLIFLTILVFVNDFTKF